MSTRPRRALISVVMCVPLAAAFPAASVSSAQGTGRDCPNGGTIRFGVEPYEDAALLAPAYQPLADAPPVSIPKRLPRCTRPKLPDGDDAARR